MRVMVTGAGGFLGCYVLRALQARGVPAVAVGRAPPADLAGASFIQADLLETARLPALTARAGASHLIHLAWFTQHGAFWHSPHNFSWVDASVRLVEAFCVSGGRHVVFAGSCAEYDWSDGRCDEASTALLPATPYGVCKDATRRLVMALCAQHKVGVAWARIFFPYGAGESAARLLPRLIAALQGDAPAFGVGGAAVRDFLHARDVAAGLLTLLQAGATGSFNISSDKPVTVADLVRRLARLLEADPGRILDAPAPADRGGDAPLLLGSNARLRAFGWRPQYALDRGLQQTLLDIGVGSRETVRGG